MNKAHINKANEIQSVKHPTFLEVMYSIPFATW